jgi:hypothetical protein
MALLKFKRSAVPAKVPALNDLALGELAINTYDGKVYTKKDDGTPAIVEIGGGSGGITTITSTDGSVTVTGSGSTRDLSVAVAGSTTNVLALVRNNTGATLAKGTVVYINGSLGQNSTVAKALATSDATSAQTLGLMTANLANNATGYVTVIGVITNINTSAFTDGQQLYLSPTTAGTFTATKPHAPDHLVYVAVVEHAHPSQGKLFVKVQNGYELDELHDVSAQSPTNGQTIVYNSTTGLWEKNTVSLTAGVNGTLPIANGGTGSTSAAAALTALGAYPATNPNGYTSNAGTVTGVTGTAPIVSSGGTAPAISISAATTSAAGSMSSADKTKLDGIATGANNYVLPKSTAAALGGVKLFDVAVQTAAANTVTTTASRTYGVQLNAADQMVVNVPWVNSGGTVTDVTGTAPIVSSGGNTPAISISAATTSAAGSMSASDKTKLDGIAANANNYVLPKATATTLGGVEIFDATVQTVAANAVTSTASRTYGVQLNAADQLVVNVPWVSATGVGTVTSVSGTGSVNGISLSGTVTSSGSLTLGGTLVVYPYNFQSQGANRFLGSPDGADGTPSFRSIQPSDIPPLNQNTTGTAENVTGTVAVANGGTGATTPAAARTNLGATTVGNNLFVLTNPSAVTFPRFNADNTVSALDAATFRSAIGAGTSSTTGTVTSVSGTGTVSGLTLTGSVTSSGSLTLGGTLTLTSGNVTTALGYTPPQPSGTGASGTWGISITGNAATATASTTATNLSTNRTNWSTNGTITAVVGQLAWKNYSNNHTIFDASNGTSPDGGAVNNTNSQIAWAGSYPTLMGWNGINTYGVRVDSARVADSAAAVTGTVAVGNGGTGLTAVGAAGNVLTSNGSAWVSSAPTGGTAGWTLLATVTASNSATVDFTTGINSTYDDYVVVADGIIASTNAASLNMRFFSNGAWQNSSYKYSLMTLSSSAVQVNNRQNNWTEGVIALQVTDAPGGFASPTGCSIFLYGLPNSTLLKPWTTNSSGFSTSASSVAVINVGGGAFYDNATPAPVTGIRFFMGTGNIAAGNFRLYGIKKA